MTLHIGDETLIHCPECGFDTYLIVRVNRFGRLFLGCPNYTPGAAQAVCSHTQSIPTDVWMRAAGQPTLIEFDES